MDRTESVSANALHREIHVEEKSISTKSKDSNGSVEYREQLENTDTHSDYDLERGPTEQHGMREVLSRISTTRSLCDTGPPPDGGAMAWTQVLMAHVVVFNTWGYVNSFGVFQTYYVSALGHPPSDISWVGTVQIFLLFFIGTFSGRAADAGYFRHVFIAGTILELFGVFMTSLATKYWQLFLAQGVCTGIGNGLLFCPVVAVMSTYFSKHRSLAIGIAASGSATGGVVFPALVQQLLPRIGFGWTIRVLGFVIMGTMLVANIFIRTRIAPRKTGPFIDWAAFRELPYVLFSIGMFLCFLGLYFAYYYIGSFGRNVIGFNTKDSISLLLILNGVGLFGRVIPNYLADRYFGPLNLILPFTFASGLLLLCWMAVDSRAGLTAFAVIYGIFAAGIQSLFPATLTSLTTDLQKVGVRMGMVFSFISFAALTGSPISGALIQGNHGNYRHAQIFAGTVTICGCLTLVAARFAKTGFVFKVRT